MRKLKTMSSTGIAEPDVPGERDMPIQPAVPIGVRDLAGQLAARASCPRTSTISISSPPMPDAGGTTMAAMGIQSTDGNTHGMR